MLYSVKDLTGYEIAATDGTIGHVRGFYFDPISWGIRFLVVDTGNILPGKKILVGPEEFAGLNSTLKTFGVSLSKLQIEDRPGINENAPIGSSLHDVNACFGWGFERREMAPSREERMEGAFLDIEKTPLRNTRDVTGFYVEAEDGDIGYVDDFIIDEDNFGIQYLVINTGNWWPGKRVLVLPYLAETIAWKDKIIIVAANREVIKDAPEYNPDSLRDPGYEGLLSAYYAKVGYLERGGVQAGATQHRGDIIA